MMLKTMGDVILGTSLCRELKRDFPDSEIHYFVEKPYGDLLKGNPYIDAIHESEVWYSDLLFMEMSSGMYDKIYAPYQVRRECNMWHQDDATRNQHLVDFYWRRMGFHRTITERECYLFPSKEDYEKSSNLISFDMPRIAVHSTSGVLTKDWPYFDDLTEEFRKKGYCVVQVGGRNDRIVKGAIDFRAKMSFMELAAFLSKCALFIGLDSGLSYMADAMKTPTIVIQGSTDPVTSGPISDRVFHLFAKETGYEDCQVVRCHVECRHEINCNTKITIEDVIAPALKILGEWIIPVPIEIP